MIDLAERTVRVRMADLVVQSGELLATVGGRQWVGDLRILEHLDISQIDFLFSHGRLFCSSVGRSDGAAGRKALDQWHYFAGAHLMIFGEMDFQRFLRIKYILTSGALDFLALRVLRASSIRRSIVVHVLHVTVDALLTDAHEQAQFTLEAFHGIHFRPCSHQIRGGNANGR